MSIIISSALVSDSRCFLLVAFFYIFGKDISVETSWCFLCPCLFLLRRLSYLSSALVTLGCIVVIFLVKISLLKHRSDLYIRVLSSFGEYTVLYRLFPCGWF